MRAQRPWQLAGQVPEGALTSRRDDGGGTARRAELLGAGPLNCCGLLPLRTERRGCRGRSVS